MKTIEIKTDKALYICTQLEPLLSWNIQGMLGKQITKDSNISIQVKTPSHWAEIRMFQFIISIDENFV